MHVSGGTAYRLYQRALRSQKTLFVCVQNGDQGNLGNIQPFAKQINSYQDVKRSQSQITQNFNSLYRVNVAVEVTNLHTVVAQIISELFGHPFRQRGDEHTLALFNPNTYFLQHIINLTRCGSHLYFRVHQTGRANKLLNHFSRMVLFPLSWRG